MTPKQILALPGVGLDYQQYTLYLPGSSDPLPLDKPIHLKRGEALEAERHHAGRAGGVPQRLAEEIAALVERSVWSKPSRPAAGATRIRRGMPVPALWDESAHDILVAIPAASDAGTHSTPSIWACLTSSKGAATREFKAQSSR